MFFHLRSLIYSILFIFVFQTAFLNEKIIWYTAFFLLLISIIGAKKIGGRKTFLITPIVLSISSIMIFYLIDAAIDRQVFIFLSALSFYLILLGIYRLKNYSEDQTARGIASAGLAVTIFFFYSGFYGIYINFSIPLWFLMLVFLFSTFILSYNYFSLISQNKKRVLNFSLILGLTMAEISWVINFWPFGYLTTGVIALIFYYMFWDIAQSYFLNKLSKRRIVANLIFFSLIISLILFSSRWQLAV